MHILGDPPESSAVECYSSCIVLWLQQSDGKEFQGGVCVCVVEGGGEEACVVYVLLL